MALGETNVDSTTPEKAPPTKKKKAINLNQAKRAKIAAAKDRTTDILTYAGYSSNEEVEKLWKQVVMLRKELELKKKFCETGNFSVKCCECIYDESPVESVDKQYSFSHRSQRPLQSAQYQVQETPSLSPSLSAPPHSQCAGLSQDQETPSLSMQFTEMSLTLYSPTYGQVTEILSASSPSQKLLHSQRAVIFRDSLQTLSPAVRETHWGNLTAHRLLNSLGTCISTTSLSCCTIRTSSCWDPSLSLPKTSGEKER